jgi:Protein of unknown function (DUF3089)
METLSRSRIVWLVMVALLAGLAAAALATLSPGGPASAGAAQVSRTDAAGTVWLCRPGIAQNPCSTTFATKAVSANGTSKILTPAAAPGGVKAKTDCFYVYPTVSQQTTINANLNIDPAEISVAKGQAARFSADCQVWAPMYTQIPVVGLSNVSVFQQSQAAAYASVLQGFQDYMKNFNKGRPIIFIGHSQGSAMLMELLAKEVDPNAKLRRQVVSVILAGGNFTVKDGSDRGGTFQNIPTCNKLKQFGCVVAYSSWLASETPPAATFFGIPGQGVSFLSLSLVKTGVHVVCTNPANLNGGSGTLIPLFPNASDSPPWTTYPGEFTAKCGTPAGANLLQVTQPAPDPNDKRLHLSDQAGPNYGLHLVDVNLAEGNLVADAAVEANTWWAKNGPKPKPKHKSKHHR